MAALTARRRKALPSSKFALPGKGEGMGSKGPGAYPVDTRRRAVSALSRVEQHGTPAEKAAVRAKVAGEYPGIEQSKGPQAKKTGGSRGNSNSSNPRNNNNSRGTTNRISREISRRLEARAPR
jgi:hypothetical protein